MTGPEHYNRVWLYNKRWGNENIKKSRNSIFLNLLFRSCRKNVFVFAMLWSLNCNWNKVPSAKSWKECPCFKFAWRRSERKIKRGQNRKYFATSHNCSQHCLYAMLMFIVRLCGVCTSVCMCVSVCVSVFECVCVLEEKEGVDSFVS